MRRNLLFIKTYLILFITLFLTSLANARILVVAPHPDDETLMFSGVIYSALSRGEPVKVVLMTNGDLYGVSIGNTRQDETVSAMVNSLGMQESNIIFLGYPDAGLTPIYTSYTLGSDTYTAANGQSTTYGHRGLGGTDYHYYTFGVHAAYNKPNILADLKSIINDFLPDNIFVTSQYDQHLDHSASYSYVRDALTDVSNNIANYRPIIHKTIIHGGDDTSWPTMSPTSAFTAPPILGSTSLDWNYRESVHLPFVMQNDILTNNFKYNTILKYNSQLNVYSDPLNNFLTNFIHKDEFFWADNIFSSNAPPIANAGQDQTVTELSTVLLDGSASTDSNGTSLTYQWTQIQGTSVALSNQTSATPSFTSPSGLADAQVLVFQLTVFDGQVYSFPETVAVTVLSTSKYVNVAPLATATASSQNSTTGQLATKAIDGVIGGCPDNCSAEWASVGQLAGAWLNLTWPQSYVINKIVLFDMPNLNEQILDGTLTFSDGTSIAIGPLTNSGSGDIFTFPAKRANSVKLTVNQANGSNIGLAEIQVFGNLSPTLAVTTTSPPSGSTGTSYSQLISGTGGQPPYTWSITSGTLPTGLTLAASTGSISGTPTATGTNTFTVQVQDASLSTATKSLSITISNKPAISTTSLSTGGLATAYSQTVAATGGQTPYTWAISSGSLPTGLALNPSSGTISGIPTTTGASTFTVQVQDANLTAATKSLTISIYTPLAVSTALLANGVTGTVYSQTLAATGGKTPYTWSVTSGSLPSGLTLKTSSGTISGTPTTAGTSTFTVQVKDANLTAATKSLTIAIYAPLAVSTASLPIGSTGTAYSQTLTATGGLTPYTWSITSGALPAGLTLAASSGVISGTPTATGTSTFTIQALDANLTAATKSLTIVIYVPLVVNTTSLTFGMTGVAYSQALSATGGLAPYTWSISSGTLPAGLTLNTSSGAISGTPTTAGTSTFTVQVKDATLTAATKSLTIAIYAPLAVSTASLPIGSTGTAYSQTLTATGGLTPYTWSITSGALPAGLTLAASSGVISGTPTATGTSTFTIQALDANLTAATKSLTIVIYVPLVVNTTSLTFGMTGVAYSQALSATGGLAPYTWSISSGTLPAGLTLNTSSGAISGTPTTAGTSTFTVQVKDATLTAATKSLTIAIYAPLAVSTASLPIGSTGTAYSQTLTATGGLTPYTWSITSGALPAGLTLAASSGVISGTPTATGTSTFTIQALDANLTAATKSLTIVIYVPLVVNTTSLTFGMTGVAYSQALSATGGLAPYTWSISSGTLPAGLTLNTSSGAISGTPTTAGTSTFTVQVKDATLTAATKSLTIAIYAPLAVSTASLPIGSTGTAYSQTLTATGGLTPYTWSITSGALPAGLTLAASSGVISGTPTATGTSTFTIQALDANLTAATKSLTIVIYVPLVVNTTSLTFGMTGVAYSQALSATGGLAPYTWSISSGTLPAGLTLNTSSGAISGTPTTAGTSTFTVQVKDANLTAATKSLTIAIYAPLAVSTASLPIGSTGTAYSQTLTATGGLTPYTWSITSGALPAGLTLAASSGVISGTPTATGTSTFTIQALDANLTAATKSLTIVIYVPLVVNTTSLTFGMTGVAYSQALSATGGLAPYTWSISSGTLPAGLTLNTSSGAISGTPTTAGTSTFTVQVKDANLTAASKSLTVTITANQPPVASNDSYSTTQNTALTVTAPGVLGNDTDPEGATLTAQLVTGPSHGTITLNSDGSFTYTPLAGYVGSDSFTYRASDGTTNSNTATVTISITSTGNVLFADDFTRSANPPAPLSPWTGVTGTWAVTSGVLNGSGTASSYSQNYYAPTPLWDNYAVEASFQYASSAFGGGLGCRVNPATGAQYAAWIYPDNSAAGHNLLVLGKMWDWTTYSGTPMAQANLTSVGTGWHTLKMVCNGNRIQVYYDGTAKIDVTDNNYDSRAPYLNGGIGMAMWTAGVVNTMSVDNVVVSTLTTNQSPVAVNDTYSTTLNTALTLAAPGVLGNDTDPEGATLTAQLVTGPSHGTLTLNSNGSFTYTPTTNYTGSDSFTYKASDGTLTSGNATVTISILTANQPPVASNDSYSTNQNTALTVAAPGVLGNDTDPEGATLSAQLVTGPSHGTLTLNSNGSFIYTPTTNYTGSDSFSYRASDGTLTSGNATVTISILTANQPPVASNDSYSTTQNTALTVTAPGVLSNDTDPEGATLTAQLVTGPSHGTLTLNSNGSFTYTPLAGYVGSDSFTYRASDGTTNSNTATVTISITSTGNVLFADDFTRSANPPAPLSPWTGVTGTWAVTSGVLNGSGTASSYSQNYYAPTPLWDNYAVEASFQYASSAFGGGLGCRVNPATGAQYAAWIYPDNSAAGHNLLVLGKMWDWTTYSGTPMAQANLTSVGTGWHTLKMVCNGNRIQVYYDGTAKIDVTDNNYDSRAPYLSGGIGMAMWTAGVVNTMSVDNVVVSTLTTNQSPVAVNDTYSTTLNTALTLAAPGVLGNDTDPEGATLTAQLVTGPSHGTITLNSDGSFTYTPLAGYVGSDSFTYRASDGTTNSNTATVTISITSTGNVLFADDFTRSANPPAPLSPWTGVTGTWAVTSGVLNGSGTASSYSQNYYAPTPLWDNYAVEASFQYASSAFGGGLGCRVNPATGAQYAAWIYPDNSAAGHNLLVLGKMWDWTTYSGTPMAQANLTSVGTGWHTLKMVCNGNRIQVYYDGTAKIDVTDNNYDSRAPYLNGGIGMAMWTAGVVNTMSVDNVVVSTLTP